MKAKSYLYSTVVFFLLLEIVVASPVNAVINIMPLGDSITKGSSSGEPDEDYMVSYRKALWDLLDADGYEVDFVGSQNQGSLVFGDPDLADHEGHAGWYADQIRDNIYNWLTYTDPVEVMLDAGVNVVTIYLREDGTRLDKIELEDSDGLGLAQEAEEGELFGFFEIVDDTAASNGQYVHVPNGTGDRWDGPDEAHKIEFTFNVPETGIYRIKGWIYAANESADSFWVKVNDSPSGGYLWDVFVNTDYQADYVNARNGVDPVNIILLHIGTNDINEPQDPPDIVFEVNEILDEIDQYEVDRNVNITVILALIINRLDYNCGESSTTTTFNDDLNDMAVDRIALGDRIEIVDMECGAGMDYSQYPVGDIWDFLHPFETGYEKMADVWFYNGFIAIQPSADAGSEQIVYEGDTVTLDGSNSSDHFGATVSYQWIQTQGTDVVLSDSQSAEPTFTAPDVGVIGDILMFQLTVTDPSGLEATDTTIVTINDISTEPICEGDFEPDGDVDGSDLAELVANPALLGLSTFAADFGRTNCP